MNKRILIFAVILIGISINCFAGVRYAVASGAWDAPSTWSLTSGGAAGAGVPGPGDDVYIGEGSGSYTVIVPTTGTHSSARIFMGSAAGNAADADLVFAGSGSSLTVAGTVHIYRASTNVTRMITVGQGNFGVNGAVFLGYPGSVANTTSVSQLNISGGTVTMNALSFYGGVGQSVVNFTGSGIINTYGDLLLVEGQGTLNPGTGTMAFLGNTPQTIDGGPNITFFDVKANNYAGIILNGLVNVYNVWSQLADGISGTPPNIDGFTSNNTYFIQIYANDIMMNGFSIDMLTQNLMPTFVNRQWNIQGTYTGNKIVSLYWNHLDDLSYDWTGLGDLPWVWNDGIPASGPSNVVDTPHYVQAIIDDASFSGEYRIGTNIISVLPVEFSAFTAVVTAQNFVKLDWTTQSETGVTGYHVYRNSVDNLNGAVVASPLIIAGNTSMEQKYTYTDTEVEPGIYYYWIENVEMNGTSGLHGSVMVTVTDNPDDPTPPIPALTSLANIYPNPFNPWTTISYELAKPEFVRIAVYNIKGQMLNTLVSEQKTSGAYRVNWDGKDASGQAVSSGLYFIRMTAGKYIMSRKAVLMQ